MIKTISIDGKECIFKSSAAIPRIYRIKFKRDIFSDLAKIQKQVIANEKAQKAKDLAKALAKRNEIDVNRKKKQREIDRELNTPLFMLRCVQLGISIRDLDLLSIGLVNDMFIEKANDDYDYPYIATQEDIDAL